MKAPPLCPPCGAEQDRWLNTTPQQVLAGLGFVMQASAAYDLTPHGVAGRRTARWQRWRDVVTPNVARIERDCLAGVHMTPPPPKPAPAPLPAWWVEGWAEAVAPLDALLAECGGRRRHLADVPPPAPPASARRPVVVLDVLGVAA